jgi:release factor glutamine methyltransferase
MLAEALRRETLWEGARVLDVGTGIGLLAITAAQRGAAVTAVDTSRRALLATRLNARLNRVPVRALRGDLFGPVQHERFDCIAAHLPDGPEGDELRERLAAEAPEHLRTGGVLLFVSPAPEARRGVRIERRQQKVGKSVQDGSDPLHGGALVP